MAEDEVQDAQDLHVVDLGHAAAEVGVGGAEVEDVAAQLPAHLRIAVRSCVHAVVDGDDAVEFVFAYLEDVADAVRVQEQVHHALYVLLDGLNLLHHDVFEELEVLGVVVGPPCQGLNDLLGAPVSTLGDSRDKNVYEFIVNLNGCLIVVLVYLAYNVGLPDFDEVQLLEQRVDVLLEDLFVGVVLVRAEGPQELEAELEYGNEELVALVALLHLVEHVEVVVQQLNHRIVDVEVLHHGLAHDAHVLLAARERLGDDVALELEVVLGEINQPRDDVALVVHHKPLLVAGAVHQGWAYQPDFGALDHQLQGLCLLLHELEESYVLGAS